MSPALSSTDELVVKLSSLTPYVQEKMDLIAQIPARRVQGRRVRFVWNEPAPGCHAWLVLDGLAAPDRTLCPRANTLFISAEPVAYKNYRADFLAQFARVISCQQRALPATAQAGHAPLPWFVNRSYIELTTGSPPQKSQAISIIASRRSNMRGHRRRLRFLRAIQKEFGPAIAWFGRKINPLVDKWDGLAPYYFSVAIENTVEKNYWTEKISDCFLARTVPLYFGAPNIDDFFPRESYIELKLDDFAAAKDVLAQIMHDPAARYARHRDALEEARARFLERHSFGARLYHWLETLDFAAPPVPLLLHPEAKPTYLVKKITQFRRYWMGKT